MRPICWCACAIASLSMHGQAHASTTQSFAVAAAVEAGCAIDGVGPSGDAGSLGTLNFGRYTTLSTANPTASLAANQTITLRCTPGVALIIKLGGGQHANNGNRNLQHGSAATQRLRYRLFSNPGMTDEIGIDQDQPITITAANTNDVKLPVYGQVTLPGDSAAGTYTDTLLVTLTW